MWLGKDTVVGHLECEELDILEIITETVEEFTDSGYENSEEVKTVQLGPDDPTPSSFITSPLI